MEVELSEAKVQLSTKDKDLQAKDVEIAELKRRLDEQIDRCESLEIDLEAEKVKAIDAEEARAVSTAALNVAQTNYSEAQGIVDTLVSEAEWMRTRGIVLVSCQFHLERRRARSRCCCSYGCGACSWSSRRLPGVC
ncbi:hypothetical protein HanPSC8_Chr03g0125521 [Helianthus annuus]|nr:hypothetical protein HanPSC8_Chr03g0125521 [Helianthus annuus]